MEKPLERPSEGASFILSGCADGDIRLWGAAETTKVPGSSGALAGVTEGNGSDDKLKRYECKRRLSGHGYSVTCVSYGRLEVVSGHDDGGIRRKPMLERAAAVQIDEQRGRESMKWGVPRGILCSGP